jgi:2-polyprenyl-6-methoxyphenol hydroxylase-like FAD-dependent oxidoreductase
MYRMQRILISGAGVTGVALACWLDRWSFDVTLVERSPRFRRGGQLDCSIQINRAKNGIEIAEIIREAP